MASFFIRFDDVDVYRYPILSFLVMDGFLDLYRDIYYCVLNSMLRNVMGVVLLNLAKYPMPSLSILGEESIRRCFSLVARTALTI